MKIYAVISNKTHEDFEKSEIYLGNDYIEAIQSYIDSIYKFSKLSEEDRKKLSIEPREYDISDDACENSKDKIRNAIHNCTEYSLFGKTLNYELSNELLSYAFLDEDEIVLLTLCEEAQNALEEYEEDEI